VLCVDVEPDPRLFALAEQPPWRGFEFFAERAPELRRRLAGLTRAPVRFTWCVRMDPQIAHTWGSLDWVAETYHAELASLTDAGDELGLHTHTWRWEPNAGHWYAELDDHAWTAQSVDDGLDAFERSFGRRCQVHRGGDHYLDGAMLERLEARGVRVDLTVEPGQRGGGAARGEPSRGTSADYRGIPTAPYRSTPDRFPRPAASAGGPLLIPLVSALGGRRIARTPIPPDSRPTRFIPRLELELLRASQPPPVLAFAVRTDAALGPRWDALVRNLEHIARRHDVTFVTATAALELFERPFELAASRA
jgi:hypothetical protein